MNTDEMCAFDSATKRCGRCGYQATSLPTFRVCRTVVEMAEDLLKEKSANRIKVPPLPLGGMVSRALSSVGVTKERVSKMVGKDCGCQARADSLDYVGAGISKAVERAVNYAANLALPVGYSADDIASVATAIAQSEWVNDGLKKAAADAVARRNHSPHPPADA